MQRILIKAAPGLAEQKLTFGAASEPFTIEPLYRSIGAQPGLGAAAADIWYVATPPAAATTQNPWDLCHAVVEKGFGVAGTGPTFAEPDIEQSWVHGSPLEGGQSLTQSCDAVDPQNQAFPRDPNDYWFRDAGHSQFGVVLRADDKAMPSSREKVIEGPDRLFYEITF
jgi:hypothetical protein